MAEGGPARRRPCARPASRSASSTPSGFAISPRRPGGWRRTIRSTPRRSPRFAEAFPDDSAQPHDPACKEVGRLVQARTTLRDLEDRIKQQREHQPPALVVQALAAVAKTLRAELRKLEAAIAARIKANPAFARRAEFIGSVPGLGDQTVAGVIAWLPELGRVSNAAALIDAAPYDDDSGQRKGVRFIRGGRRKLRDLPYMPVMGAATQHNPVLKAYYERLRARGKEAKVAIIACMRKLIVILNTMLARDEPWNPPARAAG
jgi:transposase